MPLLPKMCLGLEKRTSSAKNDIFGIVLLLPWSGQDSEMDEFSEKFQ